jgi:hypothetical protein
MDGRMHPCTPHLWKAWDYFGIQDAVLHGYWEADCPVQTGREDILASVYVKPGKALVALASWCQEDVRVKLVIDWEKLGMRPEKAILEAADIQEFQSAARFSPDDSIPVAAGRGWLFYLGIAS